MTTLYDDPLVTFDSPVVSFAGEAASPFSQEELAFLLQYMQENLMIPTPAEIATAVLAALQSANPKIPVNVKEMNDAPVVGDGTLNNKWRGQ